MPADQNINKLDLFDEISLTKYKTINLLGLTQLASDNGCGMVR